MANGNGKSVSLRDSVEYVLLGAAATCVRAVPRKAALALGNALGTLGYYMFPKRRQVLQVNLNIAFPEMEEERRRKLARKAFKSFTTGIVELLRLGEIEEDLSRYVTYAGGTRETVDRLRADGRGMIIVFFHYGNWEILPSGFIRLNMPAMQVVARKLKNPLVTDFFTRCREKGKIHVAYKGSAGRELLKALKKREAVAIPLDLNTSEREGEFVDFFGKKAATCRAPAQLALRYDTPAALTYLERLEDGKYRMHVGPVFDPRDYEDEAEPVMEMLKAMTGTVEEVIRAHPEQYMWTHRRWKTRPEGEAAVY